LLVATHRFRFDVDRAAALAAQVAIIFLAGWNQPQTATRFAQNRRTQQPLVKSDLIFYPHNFPLFASKSGYLERCQI
jgi:hypothetical protein